MKRQKGYVPPTTTTVRGSELAVGDIIWNDERDEYDHVLAVRPSADTVEVDLAYSTRVLAAGDQYTKIVTRSHVKVPMRRRS